MSSTGSTRRTGLGVLLPGFVGTELPGWLAARLRDGLAGVCLFGENIVDPAQVRALTDDIRAANPDALIAIDEEGGDVTRLFHATGSPFPGNAILGRLDDPVLTEAVGEAVARRLARAGVNLNFAPDADVNSNPDNPVIGVRSFGDDPALVARHTAAWVRGHEAAGVATSAKHFPGHGDTAQDSHLALPVVDVPISVLEARELPPFASAVEAGARTVMTSHIVLPQLDDVPATFSSRILDDLLRGRLGFQGVVVSDALDMAGASGEIGIPAAAVRAVAAGVDLLCIGTRNTDAQLDAISAALEAAVADGALPAPRLADAVRRTAELAASLRGTVPAADPGAGGSGADGSDADGSDADEPRYAPDVLAEAFDLRPGVELPPPGTAIVALETAANIAVGAAPWGPATAGAAVTSLHEGDPLPPGDAPLIVVGKANHVRGWTRAAIDRIRADRPGSLIVDMGWPAPDRAYADLATFGASRAASEALLHRLGTATP